MAMRRDMMEAGVEMLEAAGCSDVTATDNNYRPGEGIHEMGTARMGRDPSTSVLNANNQLHDVPNVLATDGARPRKVPLGMVAAVLISAISFVVVGACAQEPQAEEDPAAQDPAAQESEWTPLFNGVDLTGWTPKIRGSELGLDSARTFRVEDGLLTVSYDGYDEFGGRFGHLFYETPFSNYRILIEYRFVGDQVAGGATWALRNSGLMFHSQSPESMLPLQDFPISLEAQFLGGNGTDPRPTANLCTPGTHVEMDGELIENHCTNSTSETYHGDEWVTFEAEVLGDSLITHFMNGEPVISYSRPVIGGGTVNGFDPAAKVDGTPLTGGYISLQSESHPVQFRRVLIQELE